MTPGEKAKAGDSAGDTVRVRTSAPDQPWKQRPPADGARSADGKPVGAAEPTAAYARPSGLPPKGQPGGSAGSGPAKGPVGSGGSPGGQSRGPSGGSAPGQAGGLRGGAGPAGSVSGFPRPTPAGDSVRTGQMGDAAGLPSGGVGRGLTFEERKDAQGTLSGKAAKDRKSGIRPPRKAHLVLRRIEPWSAMKFSFVVSLVCFVVLFVAVAVLYGVLSALGVFTSITGAVEQLAGDQSTGVALNISGWFEPMRILGYTALLGAVNVVLITALSTLGAVIYNMSADLVGGVEMTFSEAE
ncbi:DUF3566 domain-containing protein [Sphaerimonospora sp. CA-214678]|uniref:DUF3566 domain-containing protein n=1 Tax=Sphaerimonospora sp. CA-214678 TaxID=3240029 RepID=UPI003D95042C